MPPAHVDSAVADLDEMVRQSQAVRRPFEPDWLLNIAFFLGKQWLSVDPTGRLFQPDVDYRSLPVDNRIKPAIRSDVARMTKQHPVFVATPRTDDEDGIYGALMAERVHEYEWGELSLTRKLRQALLWSRTAAAGFWKVSWDPTLGDTIEVYTAGDGTPLADPNGRPLRTNRDDVQQIVSALPPDQLAALKKKRVSLGDLSVVIKTPFELYPDPLAGEDGTESALWIAEDGVYDVDVAQQRWDTELDPDTAAQAGVAESRMQSIIGTAMGEGGTRRRGVKVLELWAKSSSKYPGGRHVVWANNRVLHEGPNPYGWLPYVMFRGVPVPGRFWPDAPTTDLRSPQVSLNKRLAQMDENADRIGNPPLLRPASMDPDWEWLGLPGEELVFQDNGAPNSTPAFMQVPEMPAYVQNLIDRHVNSIREISGQHEVTSAQVPNGVTAASAINLLLEQDDTLLGPDIEDLEIGLGHAGSRVLDLCARYMTDERLMRIGGEDGSWDIFEFRGEQLRGHTQIAAQAGSGQPRSKAAKQAAMQQVLDLILRYGVDVKPRDMRRFLREFEVGGLERMFSDLSVDEAQANRENRKLALGEQLPVNSYDNDETHIEAHREFQKSERFERMVRANPDIAAIVEEHVKQHLDRVVANQLAAMQPPVPPGSQKTVPPVSQNGGSANSSPTAPVLSSTPVPQ